MTDSTLDLTRLAAWFGLFVYFFALFLETHRHIGNAKMLRFIGVEPQNPKIYRAYYWFTCSLPVIAAIFSLHHGRVGTKSELIAGAAILFSSQLLRRASIMELGNGWVMGLFWDGQWSEVRSGPYRWIKDPEYISRLFDVVAFSLLFGVFRLMLPLLVMLFIATRLLSAMERRAMRRMVDAMSLHNLQQG
jgi:isoprenylcysteine carboxyl methyltransferase (ICMT) family protein YpbQ